MPKPTTLYRTLLRELPPRPLLTTPRSPLHHRIREAFASPPTNPVPADPTEEARPLAEAEQFVAYLRAQRRYGTLLERYNPGINATDEEERVRLTAKRVGMELPVEFVERKK